MLIFFWFLYSSTTADQVVGVWTRQGTHGSPFFANFLTFYTKRLIDYQMKKSADMENTKTTVLCVDGLRGDP